MDGKNSKNANINSIGQIFTPNYIAEFMVKNLVEILINEHRFDEIQKLRVLEPSVGEGIFLKVLQDYN